MEKIIMLGTGNGLVYDLYNTCFVIQNDKGNFLVDTGGSSEVIKRLKKFNIELSDVRNIMISHSHTDHILGFIWMIKAYASLALKGKLDFVVNVYCNDVVYKAIEVVAKQTMALEIVELAFKFINFHILDSDETININDNLYTFFDCRAKGARMHGFEVVLNNKKLVFLGDEPLKVELYDKARNADYVMHEAFCLDFEKEKFPAHKKNHSTVKQACILMNELNVKNLILFHTEETHGYKRSELYLEEGRKYFNGNVIVPDDFEIIQM